MRAVAIVAGGAGVLLALLFGALFYTDHVARRGCFNEQGRCFVSETGRVILAQTGMVWLGLAVLSLFAACACLWWVTQRR